MREPSITIEGEAGITPALRWVAEMVRRGLPAGFVVVKLGRETRSLRQNRRLWAMLTDISAQVVWYGHKLTPEEWKIVLSAALKKQKVVPDVEGTGFVALGSSTSRMSKQEMVELQDLMEAFGNQHGVRWNEEAKPLSRP